MKILLAMLMVAMVSACNTIEGAGEDISAGGKAISNTADSTKKAITP